MSTYEWTCTSCGWKNFGGMHCQKCKNKKITSSYDWACTSCGWVNTGGVNCQKCGNHK